MPAQLPVHPVTGGSNQQRGIGGVRTGKNNRR